MAVKIYSRKMNIGDELKNLVLVNYSSDNESCKEKDIPIHHIQILDRSGSMYYEIDGLIDDCKKTIHQMKDGDYYTVMWFSGAEEFRTILKGVEVSDNSKKSSFKVLDSIKSVIGTTCFSESVEETERIIDELESICPNFSITLFTDGEPVTPWSESEEINRVNKVLERIYPRIISFNTIGYGNYCNEDVLESWSAYSEFGEFIHSSEITDYHKIFEDNTMRARNVECSPINLEVMGGHKFFYCTTDSIIQMRSKCKFNHSNKNKNQFIFILNPGEEFEFTLNGETYDIKSAKSIPDNWINGLLYRISYGEYCYGNQYNAIEILGKSLRDKRFVDMQISAFSPDEIANFKKILKKASFRDSSLRNPNSCEDNYVPAKNAPCIIDLLNCLVSNENNMYIPTENYKRIGRKVTDEYNMFIRDVNCMCPISNVVFNKEKLNVSIRFRLDGYVMINPIQAKKVGLPEAYPCSIYRTHSIIKDGFLNMDDLTVQVTSKTYHKIVEMFTENVILHEISNNEIYIIIIDLISIPIINAMYGEYEIDQVFRSVCKENYLMAKIKYLKCLTGSTKSKSSYEQSTLTHEQATLLEEFGIKNGIYNGIKNYTPKVGECDYYMSKTFEFSLKGFSKLSPISNISGNLSIAKETNGDLYLKKFIDEEENFDVTNSIQELKEAKEELIKVRATLCGIKIAKVLTGSNFDTSKLLETKKPEVMTYTDRCPYTNKELTMNIKTSYEKSYI